MKKWEHRTEAVDGPGNEMSAILNETLHKYEVLGWELVSACRSIPREGMVGYRLFFKRQAEDE